VSQQDFVKTKSLSEIYSIQTFRKEFEKMPPFSSKKLKLTAIEGFLLQARDIVPTGDKAAGEQLASLDCQGALINNPRQNRTLLSWIMSQTNPSSISGHLMSIDVEKSSLTDLREELKEMIEFNNDMEAEMLL
jgi:hypothetical protein